MKWITRERVKVDRVACPWLIKKFVDNNAEFLFVPADKVMEIAEREGATPSRPLGSCNDAKRDQCHGRCHSTDSPCSSRGSLVRD